MINDVLRNTLSEEEKGNSMWTGPNYKSRCGKDCGARRMAVIYFIPDLIKFNFIFN